MQKRAVLFIPGIGDDYRKLQGWIIKTWRLYGVRPVLHEMPWMDEQAYGPKAERLLARVEALREQGYLVSIVAASAGAGAALNAYAVNPSAFSAVICIAGKINHPETIGEAYRQRSPSFIESAQRVPLALNRLGPVERARILSLYARTDYVVPTRDSFLPGALNRRLPTAGHAFTIVAVLLFGAPFFLRFRKRQAE